MKKKIKAIECIQTWQGEGVDVGKRMLLIRFKYCDRVERKMACNWCDTLVKMRVSPEAEYSLKEVQEILNDQKCGLMITGGEPTWDAHINDAALLLKELDYPFANVETNGYRLKILYKITNNDRTNYVFSPKMFEANEVDDAVNLVKWTVKRPNIYIKVVYYESRENFNFMEKISQMGINDRIYLMPQGCNRDELLKNTPFVLDAAEKFKVNISTRMHLMFDFI
jgi:organic radical activating enzyme